MQEAWVQAVWVWVEWAVCTNRPSIARYAQRVASGQPFFYTYRGVPLPRFHTQNLAPDSALQPSELPHDWFVLLHDLLRVEYSYRSERVSGRGRVGLATDSAVAPVRAAIRPDSLRLPSQPSREILLVFSYK